MQTTLKFRSFIETFISLSDKDWQKIQVLFVRKEYSKNDLILEEGKICRDFYFLESGIIRFFINNDGNEITKTFTIAPFCFTSKVSFRNQTPAEESIQALDNIIVWQITYQEHKKLEALPCWNLFIRKLLNQVQEYSEKFLMDMRTMTAEERYISIINQYPSHILENVPLKYLSSFLGVAPQSLSRIRNKLQKK